MINSSDKRFSNVFTVGATFLLLILVKLVLVIPLFASPPSELALSTYPLPYPGILPDHPLYFLKVSRDKIYDLLVRDVVKKSEFRLTTADKRLHMGIMLWEKRKYNQAEVTLSKGSKYLEMAYLSYLEARTEGRDVAGLADKILLSTYKHLEILSGLMNGADESIKPGLSESYQRVLHYQGELEQPTEIAN